MDAIQQRYMPQQGIPQTKPQKGFDGRPLPERSVSTLRLEEYLNLWQEHIKREQLHNLKLVEMAVTIHRRARGLTLSDMCGRYGVRRDTQGRWLDYDADLDGEIHPINIVGPAVNTNQNACLQSHSTTEVTSANQNAQNQQKAQRWQRVADYCERTGWDEAQRAFIFDAVQKDGTVLVYSYKKLCDKEASAASIRSQKMGLAMYQCECGAKGVMEAKAEDEGMTQVPCPQCQKPANAVVKALDSYEMDEAGVPIYKIESELIPFFNFTIDTYGAKIKGIAGAKWLQIQQLVDRMELEAKYPDKVFDGGPSNWCYPLRCDYALASGSWDYLNRSSLGGDHREFHKFEVRTIYLHEDSYANWRSPEDYEFRNSYGDTTFSIRRGQTINEAFQLQHGHNPGGFKFVWIDQRLVDICSPEYDTLNFRECYSDIHWRRESGSYLSSPNYSIVTIQDDITLLNTMNHNIIARNAVIPVLYDSLVFEESDFSKEFIGTKNAQLLGEDRDISKSVTQLAIPTPSPYLSNQLQFLWGIKDDISQVTPAMRGEAQKGETYAAQRQQLEQSYGGLTSVLKSFAQCKNGVFLQKAKMMQQCYTVEQFQQIGSEFGEIWSEADVEEMCESNLDEDFIISYKQGSEMPQSNMARELRFAQGIAQLMPLLEYSASIGMPLPPDKFQKILEKIDELAGFDFDLTGLEVSELIAQKHYLNLAALCAEFGDVSFEQIEAEKQNVIAVDEMGMPITQLDVITEQIFARSEIRFSQYDDLGQLMAFFIERLRAEKGKSAPNHLLVEMLHVILGMIEQAQMEIQQQAMLNDPQVQAAMAAESDAKAAEEANAAKEEERSAADQEFREKELAAKGESEETAQMLDLVKTLSGQQQEAELAQATVQGK